MQIIDDSNVNNFFLMNQPIDIGHYRFTLVANEQVKLPEFAGSLLRGSFGWALKALTCVTKLEDCDECPLNTSCHYTAFFNPKPNEKTAERFPSIPAPYLFSPSLDNCALVNEGNEFTFDLILFGKYAITQLPLIVLAWQRASTNGLGKGRSQAELTKVEHINGDELNIIFQPGSRVLPHQAMIHLKPITHNINSIKLELKSPTRIQFRNKMIGPEKLNAEIFLNGLMRKSMLYCECYLDLFLHSISFDKNIQLESQLEKKDFIRYSNRQKQRMNLEGLLGSITLTGNLNLWWPLLQLGQYTHIGKNTSFGLGKYEITHINGLSFEK